MVSEGPPWPQGLLRAAGAPLAGAPRNPWGPDGDDGDAWAPAGALRAQHGTKFDITDELRNFLILKFS